MKVIRLYSLMVLMVVVMLSVPTLSSARPRYRGPAYSPLSDECFNSALKAWSGLKMKDNETTAAWKSRVNSEVRKSLAQDPAKLLEGDDDYYPILEYCSRLKLNSIPKKWKDFYFAKKANLTLPEEHMKYYQKLLAEKPLYEMSPKEVDAYLPVAYAKFPDFRNRLMHYAHKNLGQPYNMYLLGEFPVEIYDDAPLFSLSEGDCVVFSEHMYAMTMSRNWREFMQNLIKIRYKDGYISYVTRNHYTEADWDKNNSWLVEDYTEKLGATRTVPYTEKIDRQKFFAKYGLETTFPVEMLEDTYIPYDALESVLPNLKKGDFVNIARGLSEGKGVYIGHVGLVGELPDGTKTFIHSTWPKSREESLTDYVEKAKEANVAKAKAGKVIFLGFKFLRLRADELQKQLDETPVQMY